MANILLVRISIFLMPLLIVAVPLTAQTLEQVITLSSQGNTGSTEYGNGVTIDHEGNIIVAGKYYDDIDMDPGPGETIIEGGSNIFVAKYTSTFELMWTFGLDIPGFSNALERVEVDGRGNIYVAGVFQNTVDFDPGPGVFNLTGKGSFDIFVAKYNRHGDFQWAFGVGDEESNNFIALDVDQRGNVYLGGYLKGSIDLDPGPDEFLTTSTENAAFAAKYDRFGNFVSGFNLEDGVLALDIKATRHHIYLTGFFKGVDVDFDPGPQQYLLTTLKRCCDDVFAAKYTHDGTIEWAFDVGSNEPDVGFGIEVDDEDNVYLMGEFQGTGDFDPGPGIAELSARGADLFLGKYSPPGNLEWVFDLGDPDALPIFNRAFDLALDEQGNVLMTGRFGGVVDFDPAPNNEHILEGIVKEIFLAKYTPEGELAWAFDLGPDADSTASGEGRALAVNSQGDVIFTGQLLNTADFDPGPGQTLRTSEGSDIFVASYSSRDGVAINEAAINASELKIDANVPLETHLVGNNPNPFNPTTSIQFSLQTESRVTLVVYDLLGREISRLLDGFMASGRHSVNFHAENLPSGTYIYRLTTPSRSYSKTMLLLK